MKNLVFVFVWVGFSSLNNSIIFIITPPPSQLFFRSPVVHVHDFSTLLRVVFAGAGGGIGNVGLPFTLQNP